MKKLKVVSGLVVVLLVLIVIFWKTPLLIHRPGNLISLENAVQVNQQRDEQGGKFYVTVVQTRSATL